MDLHTHPLANIAYGGKLVYGGVDVGSILPADPDCQQTDWSDPTKYVRAQSEEQALGHDRSTHGGWDGSSNACGDDLRAAFIPALETSLGAAAETFDAAGDPDFRDWPKWNDVLHQKMWVDWIRRAYDGGLRVMVALATNNRLLGALSAGKGSGPIDDKASTDLQIDELKSFVGRHSDFMEVALSSADVYRIVSGNRLAVVLGVEVDRIGNFSATPPPAQADVLSEIDRLYAEGVRYIFPIHRLDNAFGGTAADDNLFVLADSAENNPNSMRIVCAESGDRIDYQYNDKDYGVELLRTQMLKAGYAAPAPPAMPRCKTGQKNSLALLPAGISAIKRMMHLGMLIDVDHMSQAALLQTLAIAQNFKYPVNSGDNTLRGSLAPRTERNFTATQYRQIGQLHGMAGIGSAGVDAIQWLSQYRQVLTAMGGGVFGAPFGAPGNTVAAGFGTDTNGLQRSIPPRQPETDRLIDTSPHHLACAIKCPGYSAFLNSPANSLVPPIGANCVKKCDKQFPTHQLKACLANCGAPPIFGGSSYSEAFPASTTGTRTWDYKSDGVAHYGMLRDFVVDLAGLPGGGANMVNNNLMQGADYFYHTWQIAERQSKAVR